MDGGVAAFAASVDLQRLAVVFQMEEPIIPRLRALTPSVQTYGADSWPDKSAITQSRILERRNCAALSP